MWPLCGPRRCRPTFHMSSFLLLIAVVAVCLGAGRDQPVLGIVLAAVVVPAAVYTMIVAFRSAGTGSPMSVFDKVWSFAGAIAGVLAIEFAALVAFCMSCIPAGFITMGAGESGIIVAVVIGGLAAVAAAAYMTDISSPGNSVLPGKRGNHDATSRPHLSGHDPEPLSGMPGAGAGEDHRQGEPGLLPQALPDPRRARGFHLLRRIAIRSDAVQPARQGAAAVRRRARQGVSVSTAASAPSTSSTPASGWSR